MRAHMVFGGLVVGMLALGCSRSSEAVITPPRAELPAESWSDSVLVVGNVQTNEEGQIRGVVLDSAGIDDPSLGIPVAGVTVSITSSMPPAAAGYAWSFAIQLMGQVGTDANGRFVVTSVPPGYLAIGVSDPATHAKLGSNPSFTFSHDEVRADTIYAGHGAQQ